jgi:hypothetical protein
MKEITRREMFKEIVSKDTVRKIAGSWYGFAEPFMAEQNAARGPKKGSLLEVVKRLDSQHMKHDRKEG